MVLNDEVFMLQITTRSGMTFGVQRGTDRLAVLIPPRVWQGLELLSIWVLGLDKVSFQVDSTQILQTSFAIHLPMTYMSWVAM